MNTLGVLGVTIGILANVGALILLYCIKKHPEWFKDI